MSKRRFPISIIAEIYEPKCETTSFRKALSLLHLPNFQSPPSVSFSDSTSFHFITQCNPHSLIHNSTASPCPIFRDQQVLTMSSKSLNPNVKPFFHFPSITYTKPLNPNANPFHIQTYLCNPSWQWRPFIPKTRNKLTMDNLPRVRQFSRTMNHNIPVRRKHHVLSGPSVHVWKAKPEEHKDRRNDKLLEKKRSSKGKVIPFPLCSSDQKPFCTTAMIKNIPNHFRRTNLVTILRSHCKEENKKSQYKSEFDFVYLPMDFQQYWEKKRVVNLGYAFVNFTSYVAALRFFQYYHNREWKGKEALMRRFENSVFWCHIDMYLPVVLEPACDGELLPDLINVESRVCAPSRKPRTK